jgi:hypothetical protein
MDQDPNIHTKVAIMEGQIQKMAYELWGNGKPGLVSRFSDHMHDMDVRWKMWDQREKDKMTYDDRQEKRAKNIRNWIVAATGIGILLLTVVSTALAILMYEHETKHTLLEGFGAESTYATYATERMR